MNCVKISLIEWQNHPDANILMTSVTGHGLLQSTPGATNGLDRLTIDAYPASSLGSSRCLPNPNDNVCSIFLCEYQANEMLRTIPNCNHYFHADCIDQWLKLNVACPIRRDKFEELPYLALSSVRSVVGLSL
ncbi:putative RING-H2 finger protein ATL69 [Hibiscus syriacus]|uniref:RING-H2 finger protein ATL69 n=1 Tax=Hibiscus syriacus TaxID=106335 RepID=A0A6A2ZS61_HIBSY|nr:putative RING-H2 finger protein ATL69 [Hibiscus syriacus]